jgi:Zn-dependent protease with chaperone function
MEYAQVLDSEVVRVRKESPGVRMSSRLPAVLMVLVFAVGSCVSGTLASPPQSKWSGSDANINAIGHRRIALDPNFYSPEREKELGMSLSQEFERTSMVLNDPVITEYIARVAQNVAKNSDARMLITVRVVDSDAVNAVTLPAGYQYVTRGLLLRLENEAELASVLARGVAHTALRSATWIATKADIMQLATSVARPSTRSDSTTSFDGSFGHAKNATRSRTRRGLFWCAVYVQGGLRPEVLHRFRTTIMGPHFNVGRESV